MPAGSCARVATSRLAVGDSSMDLPPRGCRDPLLWTTAARLLETHDAGLLDCACRRGGLCAVVQSCREAQARALEQRRPRWRQRLCGWCTVIERREAARELLRMHRRGLNGICVCGRPLPCSVALAAAAVLVQRPAIGRARVPTNHRNRGAPDRPRPVWFGGHCRRPASGRTFGGGPSRRARRPVTPGGLQARTLMSAGGPPGGKGMDGC